MPRKSSATAAGTGEEGASSPLSRPDTLKAVTVAMTHRAHATAGQTRSIVLC